MSHAERRQTVTAESVSIPAAHRWRRLPLLFGALGLIGLGSSFALGSSKPEQLAFSWLVAFVFWLSLALGSMFFVLVHFVTRASWSVVLRRLAEFIMGTIPLFALLFVPILLWMKHLFPWTDSAHTAHDPLMTGFKLFWLTESHFYVRAPLYFASWILIGWYYRRGSIGQDAHGNKETTLRLIRYSGPALFLYSITLTLAAVDWLMSLDPHWYSTMFGVYYFAGCLVGIFALMAVLASRMRAAGLLGGTVTTEHFHDIGKLLFGFTVFWAYIAFSQYFLIWYGNIPEETVFFAHRMEGSWASLSAMLMWGHFAVPFLFLMSRHIKRRAWSLTAGSLWMLLMHYADLYWVVMPSLHHHGLHFSPLDLTTMAGIGCLFMAAVTWQMRTRALVPHRDPRLAESLNFENA